MLGPYAAAVAVVIVVVVAVLLSTTLGEAADVATNATEAPPVM